MATKDDRKRVAIYLRVSTDGQTVENQRRELRAVAERHGWNVVAEFADKGVSGAKPLGERAGGGALMTGLHRRDFDMIAAWSVDRLGRSLQDLVKTLDALQAKGVGLFLHQQGLDTSTPAGKAMFGMLGVFADFERAIIRERIMAGIARAREKGEVLIGRPKIDAAKEAKIRKALKDRVGILKIAKTVGVGVSAVQRVKAEMATA